MGSLRDEIEAESRPQPTPGPSPTPPTVNEAHFDIVKGDLAKAMAPSVGDTKPLASRLKYEIEKDMKGYAPATPMVLAPPDVAKSAQKSTSLRDEMTREIQQPISTGVTDPKDGDHAWSDYFKNVFSKSTLQLARLASPRGLGQRVGQAIADWQKGKEDVVTEDEGKALKTLFTTLSLEEHSSMYLVNKALGKPAKKDLSDYTVSNTLKDLGAPDNILTDAAGAITATVLSPSTYLTKGYKLANKIGLQTGLTDEGKRLVNNITKTTAESLIAKKEAALGKALDTAARNEIIRKTNFETEQMVLKRFGEINSFNKELSVSSEVETLPSRIKASEGWKFKVPLSGGREIPIYRAGDIKLMGKTIVPGEEVAKNIVDSGVAKYQETILSNAQNIAMSRLDKTTSELSDELKKLFVHQFGVDKNLVQYFRRAGPEAEKLLANPAENLTIDKTQKQIAYMVANWQNAEDQAKVIRDRSMKYAQNLFKASGLTKEEQSSFMDTMIKASVESDQRMRDFISAGHPEDAARALSFRPVLHENPKVQSLIDRWVGQGKFALEKQEVTLPSGEIIERKISPLQKKFAEKAQLLEEGAQELPVWVPGVIEEYAQRGPKFKKSMNEATREFATSRVESGTYSDLYIRDPVQALGHRLTEISYANLQDKTFNRIVQALKKEGQIKDFVSLEQAQKFGYEPIRAPFYNDMMAAEDLASLREARQTYFVPKNIADQYNLMIKEGGGIKSKTWNILLDTIAKPTSVLKQHLLMAPSYFARNFNSNIILNSMQIGGHAIDPKKVWFTTEAVLKRNWEKEARPISEGLVKRTAFNAAVGGTIGAATSDNPMQGFIKGASAGAVVGTQLNDQTYKAIVQMVYGKGLDRTFTTATGERLVLKDFIKEAQSVGAIKSGFFQHDISGAGMEKTISEVWSMNLAKYANPMSPEWIPSVFGKKFNEAIETQARMINYLTHRMNGLSPEIAAAEVNEALFDYGAITPFEKDLNKSIIPFYTFSKKNLEAHMKLLAQRPGMILNQAKFFRDLGPSDEELNNMPKFERDKFIVKVRDMYVSGFGLPVEDLLDLANDPSGQLGARLNPFIRAPIEIQTNKEFFSGRRLEEINSAKEFKMVLDITESNNTPAFIKKPMEEIRNFLKLQRDPTKPDKVIGDPNMLFVLRNLGTSRYQSMIGHLSEEDRSSAEKAWRFLLGVHKVEEDPGLTLSIAKKEATQKAKTQALKTNTSRFVDRPYAFGDPIGAEIANDIFDKIKDAHSPEEIDLRLKMYKEQTENLQRMRVGE